MSGLAYLAWIRLRRGGLPVVSLALIAAIVLGTVALPIARELALSAASRAVFDIGGLLARGALLGSALALGTSAVGPNVRAGRVDGWSAHGLSGPAFVVLRWAADGVGLGLLTAASLAALWLGSAALGTRAPASLPAFALAAFVEAVVLYGLASLCGCWLRGAAGPLTAVVWCLASILVSSGIDASGWAWWLRFIAPHAGGLDPHAVLLGAAVGPASVGALLHAALWVGACALGSVGWLAFRDRR